MISVLLADDEALIRGGLRSLLEIEDDISVVGEAGDGADAIEQIRLKRPDVALMDIRMPKLDGIEATRRLMQSGENTTRIVVLTTFGMDDYVFHALRAGAAGFLLKDTVPERLVEAIRSAARGETLLAHQVTRTLIEHYVQQPHPSAEEAARLAELSTREHEILTLVAQGLSNREIGARVFLSEATVKTHVSAVLAKLGLATRTQAVVYAYEVGVVRAGGRPHRGGAEPAPL